MSILFSLFTVILFFSLGEASWAELAQRAGLSSPPPEHAKATPTGAARSPRRAEKTEGSPAEEAPLSSIEKRLLETTDSMERAALHDELAKLKYKQEWSKLTLEELEEKKKGLVAESSYNNLEAPAAKIRLINSLIKTEQLQRAIRQASAEEAKRVSEEGLQRESETLSRILGKLKNTGPFK